MSRSLSTMRLALAGALALAAASVPAADYLVGEFVHGEQVSLFEPCGGEEALWLLIDGSTGWDDADVTAVHVDLAVRPSGNRCGHRHADTGPSRVSEKIYNSNRGSPSAVEPSSRMPRACNSSTGSPWPGKRSSNIS